MALELRQVEVRPGAALELLRVVEEVEAEVEERAGDRLAVDDARAARAGASRAGGRTATAGSVVRARSTSRPVSKSIVPLDRVAQVDLALDVVRPGRRVRVLEVGHEDPRARVERVDDHLPVDRAGDLDAAVAAGRPAPARRVQSPLADLARLGEEVRPLAGVEALLALLARARAGAAARDRSADAARRRTRAHPASGSRARGPSSGPRISAPVTRFRGPAHRGPGTCRARAPTSGRAPSWAPPPSASAA